MPGLPQSLNYPLLYFNTAEISRCEIIIKLHMGMRVQATKLITGWLLCNNLTLNCERLKKKKFLIVLVKRH